MPGAQREAFLTEFSGNRMYVPVYLRQRSQVLFYHFTTHKYFSVNMKKKNPPPTVFHSEGVFFKGSTV